MGGLVDVPFFVKIRDEEGRVGEGRVDSIAMALEDVKHFRDHGYSDVWIEGSDGNPIDESTLVRIR
jgi:hypothetical protein